MNTPPPFRWSKALTVSIAIFASFSLYLFLRRGYFNLYIANKALGDTAVVIAGIALLVGPLRNKSSAMSWLLTIRRQLGLSAFGFALLHAVISLLILRRTPLLLWMQNQFLPIAAGFIALTIWAYLAYLSRDNKVYQLGVARWLAIQRVAGKVAFGAIFLHLCLMKYHGWVSWFRGQIQPSANLANPSYPPASLLVFLFMLGVIVYRSVRRQTQ